MIVVFITNKAFLTSVHAQFFRAAVFTVKPRPAAFPAGTAGCKRIAAHNGLPQKQQNQTE
jgi:hypothetical protein